MFLNRDDVKHHPSREDVLNQQAWSSKVVYWIKIKVSEFLFSPELSDWRAQPFSLLWGKDGHSEEVL